MKINHTIKNPEHTHFLAKTCDIES